MRRCILNLLKVDGIAISGLVSICLLLGLLGCQGCKSGPGGNGDAGSPEDLLNKEDGNGETTQNGTDPTPVGPSDPRPAPKSQDRNVVRLAETLDQIEDGILAIKRDIPKNVQNRDDLYQVVLDRFTAQAKARPEDPISQYLVGHVLLFSNKPSQARSYFNKALDVAPWFLPSWRGIALSYAREKNEEKCAEAIQEINNASGAGAMGLILLGQVLAEVGKVDQAEKVLLKARDDWPGSTRPLLKLAEYYRSKQLYSEALGMLDKAVRLDGKDPRVWFVKAETHYLMMMEARMRLRKGDQKAGQDAADHVKLAIDALETVVKLAPDSVLGRDAKDSLEDLKDPKKKYMDAVLDPSLDLRTRLQAALVCLQQAREFDLEDWLKVIEQPEKDLRKLGIKALSQFDSVGSAKALTRCLQKGSVFERAEAVGAFKKMHRNFPKASDDVKDAAISGLMEGMRYIIALVEKGADPDFESPVFQDILDTLERFTGNNFGEGRSNRTTEGMNRTLAEWTAWKTGEAMPVDDGGEKNGGEKDDADRKDDPSGENSGDADNPGAEEK